MSKQQQQHHSSEQQLAPAGGKWGAPEVKPARTEKKEPFLCCRSCKIFVAKLHHIIPYDLDKRDESNRLELLFDYAFNWYNGEAEIRACRRLEAMNEVAAVHLTNIYCSGCKSQQLGWLIMGAQAHHPVIRPGQYILQLSSLLLSRDNKYREAKNMPLKKTASGRLDMVL